MTGHDDGRDHHQRRRGRSRPSARRCAPSCGEPYRTLLGHFRHEIGHYYWDRLVSPRRGSTASASCSATSAPTTPTALRSHYDNGPPADWPTRFVSSYAVVHPWEDWAETWAHYLHMADTPRDRASFGVDLQPRAAGGSSSAKAGELELRARRIDFDDFDDLVAAWGPLTVALNALNRSMGSAIRYPFVLPAAAVEKIRFVHEVIERAAVLDEKACCDSMTAPPRVTRTRSACC